MVSGLARCLRSESVSLNLITVDFDGTSTSTEQMGDIITMFADQQAKAESLLEAEYLVDKSMIYTSRLAPIHRINRTCTSFVEQAKVSALQENTSLDTMVQSSKLPFQHHNEKLQSLEDTQVEVKILFVAINETVSSEALLSVFRD